MTAGCWMHFLRFPGTLFVSEDLQMDAYEDYPLPIGHGQTISQPYIVALMTSLLELNGDERMFGSWNRVGLSGCYIVPVGGRSPYG